MKELKSFIVLYDGKFIRAYHETEVDEVIAALYAKLRQQNLLLGNYKLLIHSKVGFNEDSTKPLRHNKYKRWFRKWLKRLLTIAEKFKEARQ